MSSCISRCVCAVCASCAQMHVESKEWEDAFLLAEAHPGKFNEAVFLPYAEWLAIEDRFEDAQQAYERFGRLDLAVKILQQLTHNAVVEGRYADAANGYYHISEELVKAAQKAANGEVTFRVLSYRAFASTVVGVAQRRCCQGGGGCCAFGVAHSSDVVTSNRYRCAFGRCCSHRTAR